MDSIKRKSFNANVEPFLLTEKSMRLSPSCKFTAEDTPSSSTIFTLFEDK